MEQKTGGGDVNNNDLKQNGHAAKVNSYESASVKNNCKDEDQSTGQTSDLEKHANLQTMFD